MPIDYKEYPDNWHEISLRIRERAHWKCERCGISHNSVGVRNRDGSFRPLCSTEWDWIHDKRRNGYAYNQAVKKLGFTRIVLTVAHLNHIKNDVRDENLEALCQACHLKLDMKHHVFNRRYGRKAKENNLSLGL